MNIRTLPPLTPDEFLHHPALQNQRCELSEGRIVMMTGASKAHREITGNLFVLLHAALDRRRYHVAMAELAVRVGSSVRYPDVVVDVQSSDPKGLTAVSPQLIAEVISPSSVATDFGPKVREYTSLPSLQAYLVLSQDEPRAWLWPRTAEGGFPEEPEMLVGREATIPLPGQGLMVALADIYPGESV
jgi:Uma2 family endonuclease